MMHEPALIKAVGLLGMIAIEGSYLPQLWRLFRLKHANEVSVAFPALNLAGRLLAFGFSVATGQSVFIAGFALGILLRGTLLSQVLWYRHLAAVRAKQAADSARVLESNRNVASAHARVRAS